MSEATLQLYRIFEDSPQLPAQIPPFEYARSHMTQISLLFKDGERSQMRNACVALAMLSYSGDPDLIKGITGDEYDTILTIGTKLAYYVKNNMTPPRRVLPLAPIGAYLTGGRF